MQICKKDILVFLAELLEIDVERVMDIGENDDLTEIGLSSISYIHLVVWLEEKYDFCLKDDDLLIEKLNTLGKIYVVLDKYLGNVGYE